MLSPTEDMDLYIDSRQSIISTSVLILDDGKCTELLIKYHVHPARPRRSIVGARAITNCGRLAVRELEV